MANKKTKNSPEYVWELVAPRVNHLLGVFPSLNAAHNTACKLAEPDDRVNETKKYMSLDYNDHRDRKGKEFYEIWDESVLGWYEDPPLFRITKLKIGKTYKDYDPKYETEEEEKIVEHQSSSGGL